MLNLNYFRISIIIKLIVLGVFSGGAIALSTDHLEKVYIVSDSSNHNYITGVDSYEGNVKIDQGSTHITADRLVTKKNSQHQMFEVIAYGLSNKVHFWTTPNLNDPMINATARTITFYPIESTIHLTNDVEITQGNNKFTGELVHYNKKTQIITVPPSKNARAVIIYTPE